MKVALALSVLLALGPLAQGQAASPISSLAPALTVLDALRDLNSAPPVKAALDAEQAARLTPPAGGLRTHLEGLAQAADTGLSGEVALVVQGSLLPTSADPPEWARARQRVTAARLAEARRRALAWHAARLQTAEVAVARTAAELAGLQRQVVQARLDAGAAHPLQLEAARLAQQQADLALTQAGLGAAGPASTAAWAPLPLPPADHQGVTAEELEARLALLDAQAALRSAQEQARPWASLGAQVGAGPVQAGASVDSRLNVNGRVQVAAGAPAKAGWSLTLRATLPLRGGPGAALQAADLRVKGAHGALLGAQQAAQERVRTLRTDYPPRLLAVTLAEQARALTERTLDLARQRLEAGLISGPDVLAAQLDLDRAEMSLLNAQRSADELALDLWDAQVWLPGDP